MARTHSARETRDETREFDVEPTGSRRSGKDFKDEVAGKSVRPNLASPTTRASTCQHELDCPREGDRTISSDRRVHQGEMAWNVLGKLASPNKPGASGQSRIHGRMEPQSQGDSRHHAASESPRRKTPLLTSASGSSEARSNQVSRKNRCGRVDCWNQHLPESCLHRASTCRSPGGTQGTLRSRHKAKDHRRCSITRLRRPEARDVKFRVVKAYKHRSQPPQAPRPERSPDFLEQSPLVYLSGPLGRGAWRAPSKADPMIGARGISKYRWPARKRTRRRLATCLRRQPSFREGEGVPVRYAVPRIAAA